MAHHPSAGHGSPDDEYLATPPGSTYEHTDADTRPLARFLIGCVVSAVVIHFGLAGAYQLLVKIGVAQEAAEREYPMSEGLGHQLPPAPRLPPALPLQSGWRLLWRRPRHRVESRFASITSSARLRRDDVEPAPDYARRRTLPD